MPNFMDWLTLTIRKDPILGSWLEERKYDIVPVFIKFLQNLSANKSILFVCDDKRQWLGQYILTNINNPTFNRPIMPLYDMNYLKDKLINAQNETSRQYIKDVFDLSFCNKYIIWYIGDSNDRLAYLPKVFEDSFLWIFDEDIPNALEFNNEDISVDFKLMQIFRLLNCTIDAFFYQEFEI